mgnify:CR=1 FL=1
MLSESCAILRRKVNKAQQIWVSRCDEASSRRSLDCLIDGCPEVQRHRQLLIRQGHREVRREALLLKQLLIVLFGIHPHEHEEDCNRLWHI